MTGVGGAGVLGCEGLSVVEKVLLSLCDSFRVSGGGSSMMTSPCQSTAWVEDSALLGVLGVEGDEGDPRARLPPMLLLNQLARSLCLALRKSPSVCSAIF